MRFGLKPLQLQGLSKHGTIVEVYARYDRDVLEAL